MTHVIGLDWVYYGFIPQNVKLDQIREPVKKNNMFLFWLPNRCFHSGDAGGLSGAFTS